MQRQVGVFFNGSRQLVPGNADIFESVKKENANDYGEESTQGSNDISKFHAVPFFEEDNGADHHHGCEAHIINGSDQRRIKHIQWLVEVVDLSTDGQHQNDA